MLPHFRILSVIAGCGLSFLLIPLAEAATVTNEFLLQLVINKQWCEVSSTHASKETIKEENTFKITIVQDPQNNGHQEDINANVTNLPGTPP